MDEFLGHTRHNLFSLSTLSKSVATPFAFLRTAAEQVLVVKNYLQKLAQTSQFAHEDIDEKRVERSA